MNGDRDLLQRLMRMHELIREALSRDAYPAPEIDRRRGSWEPAADIVKSPDGFVIVAELPGVPKESVKLEVEGDSLILSGERPARALPQGGHFRRAEAVHGRFRRAFKLPQPLDPAEVHARLADGLLEIRVASGRKPDSIVRLIEIR